MKKQGKSTDKMSKTASQVYRVLLIEDDSSSQMALQPLVKEESVVCDYKVAGSVSKARKILDSEKFDVVITDYLLGDGTVFDIFELLTDTPVIVVTGSGNEEVAVKAMKAGAYDYIVRDPESNYLKVLPLTIENAIKRKKSEDKLRILDSAVSNANDAIIILEAEPGKMRGRRILYVNGAFTRMTGYTFHEATVSTLRMLRGPKTSLKALDKIRVALEQFRPVRVELVNYRKDGSEFWVECNIVPLADKNGLFHHWVSVQRDITERKKAEGEREGLMKEIEAMNADLTELNQELETIGVERTMSLMALTVADRIRNPAAMIGGRCKRMLNKNNISLDMKEGLENIMEGAEKLDKIVKDFETLLNERQYKFKYEDLNRIVEKVVSVIHKETKYKGVEMKVTFSNGSLRMKMHKDLMRVAVFHLIKNAVEATSVGGRIMVKTFKDGDKVVLSVSDSGYGIPEEDVEHVFRPFFSTKEKRFGMGLPLVKQIVSEHLGNLLIDSESGNGSTFIMEFPTSWLDNNPYDR